ncbi:MAG: DNA polymerase III subunit gamma/tau [Christensenella sp.]|uniref:DNA polymerase III subunit gamma/tau n=1 Tax=Christensenella sp. TaxID=1935934 RepID=UPI002B1EF6F3|nr:DNA polymerase III subunit gamma/tau [Christensenella sp.]MEA5002467.1 DNA polymerase III subunit gamma/tau [Christensenella sp.]
MAYKTLYRVFRPSTFDEVYGQQHITDILKKQIMSGRQSHAYLFYGPRGTGKTSTAKILANALNCLDPQNGNPCGKCEVCRSLKDDAFVDIVEIDAASNNSVDNVRDIREKVSLLPALGKYKVYIIDEVHMLSPGAFNALLKTLEEPPPHAVFILATTELRKLPGTILSRCQRYDFKRISDEDIVARLKEVAGKTGVSYEEEAIDMIAQSAEGAMRDALSIMDQCIAGKEQLTLADVNDAMGVADSVQLKALCDAILEENQKQALLSANEMIQTGVEPHNILRDVVVELSARLARDVGDAYKCANLLRVLEVFIYNQNTLRYASTPDAVLIAAVVRAASNTTDVDTKDMELRVKKLEQRVEKLAAGIAQGGLDTVVKQTAPTLKPTVEKPPESKPAAQSAAIDAIETEEQKEQAVQEKATIAVSDDAALKQFKTLVASELPVLAPVTASIKRMVVRGSILDLYADEADGALMDMLKKEEYAAQMSDITAKIFGHPMVVDIVYEKEQKKEEKSIQEQLAELVGKDKVIIK